MFQDWVTSEDEEAVATFRDSHGRPLGGISSGVRGWRILAHDLGPPLAN